MCVRFNVYTLFVLVHILSLSDMGGDICILQLWGTTNKMLWATPIVLAETRCGWASIALDCIILTGCKDVPSLSQQCLNPQSGD